MMLARFLLLLAMVVAEHHAFTPPNARPSTEELRNQRGSEQALPLFVALLRTMLWANAILECGIILAVSGNLPSALARLFYDPNLTVALTPTFVVGALLRIAGALLRVYCFRILGVRFTFELSIRPKHKLVTHGIYGIVRHPSYTGCVMIALGWLICVSERWAWFVRFCMRPFGIEYVSGDGSMEAALWIGLWMTELVLLCVVSKKRMDKEDAMLERAFGEGWRAWAGRVPYRLVPGVY